MKPMLLKKAVLATLACLGIAAVLAFSVGSIVTGESRATGSAKCPPCTRPLVATQVEDRSRPTRWNSTIYPMKCVCQ